MAQHHPGSGLLLRIRADDPAARCQLGNKVGGRGERQGCPRVCGSAWLLHQGLEGALRAQRVGTRRLDAISRRLTRPPPPPRPPPAAQYGAELACVPRLLEAAAGLGLCVRGVSFHVGSGAKNPAAFSAAIKAARRVFDLGAALGFRMDVLDLGGGFCGGEVGPDGHVDLGGVPDAINVALDRLFPDDGAARGWHRASLAQAAAQQLWGLVVSILGLAADRPRLPAARPPRHPLQASCA